MQTQTTRSFRAAATFAAVLACVAGTATGVGRGDGDDGASAVRARAVVDVGAAIQKAADDLSEGRVWHAKSLLIELTERGGEGLASAERTRAFNLLRQANARLRAMDRFEVSLQKADFAVEQGNLALAEQHARAVLASGSATGEQGSTAEVVLSRVGRAREAMSPRIPGMLDAARAALDAGRVEEARSLVDQVRRSGVELSAEDGRRTELFVAQIARAEHSAILASAMQPGVVKPVETGGEGAGQPADPPAAPPPDLTEQARKAEAASLLGEADRAFEAGRYAEAKGKFEQVLDRYRGLLTAEEAARAQDRLTQATLELRGNPGQGPLEDFNRSGQIAKQERLAEFESQMAQSARALASDDVTLAEDLVRNAMLTLRSARDKMSEGEYEALTRRATAQLESVQRRRLEIERAERARLDAELQGEARAREATLRQERETRILESLRRVRALQQELKYDEALQVLDQILFLDPINPAAQILKDIITDTRLFHRYRTIRARNLQSYAQQSLDNDDAVNAPTPIVDYPADWPGISIRRGEPAAFVESAENRRVSQLLETKRIPAEFRDNTFADVVAYIQTVTQLNVDVDWQSLEIIGVSPESQVTMKLSNVPVRTVLDRVTEKVSPDATDVSQRAGWAVSDGVLKIASESLLRKERELVIYDIKDLLIEIPDYANAPEFDLNSVLQSSGQGGSSQSPFQQNQQQNQADRRPLTERTQELINIITKNVDFDGWQENGGDTGFIQQLQGSLIITNTARNHKAIDGLLSKLRAQRAMQINVETRFLLVSEDWFEQIGFDLDVYFNANNNQIRALQGPRPGTLASDLFPNGVGPARSVPPITGTGPSTLVPLATNWTPIGVVQNSSGLARALLPGSGIAGAIANAAPALGISGQFLDDIQVDFLITATQADRRTVSLTAPRLTFTNGQTANIYVATQIAFVSDLQPIVSESAAAFDPDLAVVNEGVRLLVDGTISADRRYVTLNVDASVAKLRGFAQQAVAAIAGGQLVSSAATQSFIQLPTVTVTRVQTTVTVPDQGTILLGGQRIVNETETEVGVPVLSKIPVLNRFFSNRATNKEEQTLLILLKPTILIQNEEEERNFPGLLNSLRTGLGG